MKALCPKEIKPHKSISTMSYLKNTINLSNNFKNTNKIITKQKGRKTKKIENNLLH